MGVGVVAALGLVLLFMLAQATGNREVYERYYPILFVLNIAVAGLLALVIVWAAVRMGIRWRQRKFGSRLLVKLAAIFALVGLLPGLMIYIVSYQFVSRSIESWFDVRVEAALASGLQLGRSTLERVEAEVGNRARAAADQTAQTPEAGLGLSLERLREQLGVREITLWSASGQPLASASRARTLLLQQSERPTSQQMRQARSQSVVTQIEGLDDASPVASSQAPRARVRALAVVNSPGFSLGGAPRYLQLIEDLPADLVANALAVQEANREYQERALARDGLRRMYIGTLTLTLFLAVFGAVLLAVLLGTQLAKPLLLLAEGVRQVARGDLRPKTTLQTRDELGGLTRSFADMTQQLAEARSAVQVSMSQVDAARESLQTILDNLTAGVMVLDAQGRIISSNPGATRILRAPLAAQMGKSLAEIPGLQDFGEGVHAQFEAYLREKDDHGQEHWQQSFELYGGIGVAGDAAVTLIARGTRMPGTQDCLLVFDDVTEVVSAQRAQAWGEVARRLAHEIKNPLTPIQLSAERLERKLADKLEGSEQQVLTKSVRTIVDQVDAMKRLVNEFRDFGRLPKAELRAVDLNALVTDVMQLYPQDQGGVPVALDLAPGLPLVRGDPQQLRQVIHNLLQNAQDAHEGKVFEPGEPGPLVTLQTEYSEASRRVRLLVRDRGCGFPDHILKRAFEPYVTSKAKGTGLGLAVVKKIADEHQARIDIGNRSSEGQLRGAQVSLSFPIEATA
ncbi:MAG: HAMP domain-containing protein [Betaproteobacteria bacterium]|nr:HAMP domain-containing protein [Betaproteobacteria bacterium]